MLCVLIPVGALVLTLDLLQVTVAIWLVAKIKLDFGYPQAFIFCLSLQQLFEKKMGGGGGGARNNF